MDEKDQRDREISFSWLLHEIAVEFDKALFFY